MADSGGRVGRVKSKTEDHDPRLERWVADAFVARAQSDDPHTQVGAVLIGKGGSEITRAANGLPRGTTPNERNTDRENTKAKYEYMVHAEMNCLATAARDHANVVGSTMITSLFPCGRCAGMMVNFGVAHVYAPPPDMSVPHWRTTNEASVDILLNAEKEGRFRCFVIEPSGAPTPLADWNRSRNA
jgi:deoxycytidylate deaminase